MRTRRPKIKIGDLLGEDVLIIGPEPPGETAAGRSPFRHGNFRRIAGATALFLSLLIALIAMLEQDRISAMVFALIALGCLSISVYPARRKAA